MSAPELRATYRLQLGPGLEFRDARALVPYLEELGVSHLYLSPSLQARSGSTHGYDVVDPTTVSEDLGGESELRALAASGLGIVLDIVPNHMATDEEQNPFWRDPLWRAKFFDLDWRTGSHRRFFDVGELAGVRVEDPEVYEATHATVIRLARDGVVDGVRIDHPDGLADPARYLERLRESGLEHVWVEKILEPGERLRGWPVEGTTGYEFLNDVMRLFVDPAGEDGLTRVYRELTGEARPFHDVAAEAKLEQARTTFALEADQFAAKLPEDVLEGLDMELALASLPVYRTYVDPDRGLVADADREAVAALPERLQRILLLEERGHDAFVIRFQQTSPPVMAKGVEDTAFYRWFRLSALNEVGGDPGVFSLAPDAFHRASLERLERFPLHMLSTMTHDAKRSADVRARIAALSRFPGEWAELAHEWAPRWRDPNEGILVLQTLVGVWPVERERLDGYLEKALREGKVNTNWIDQNHEWEDALKEWADGLQRDEAFLARFRPLAERVRAEAVRQELGQVLLKLTSPGVPDLYQGDEAQFLALVDPDNRRPVDWAALRRAAASPEPGSKLDLVKRTLALRRERPAAFAGAYEPVEAGADVVAFTRGGAVLAAVAPRGDLSGLRLPPGSWDDVVAPQPWLRLLARAA